jgi:cytochrome c oxidase cbb3-type subunit 1
MIPGQVFTTMQTRNNPFLLIAGLYLSVGLLAVVGRLSVEFGALDSLPRLRWLTIHFVTIGGLTQALFGALPALVSSADAPTAATTRNRWFQWLTLNGGYPLVLIGMATGDTTTAVVGATLVLVALGGLLVTVFRTSTSGDQRTRFFRTAPWFLVVGILAAFGMLLNRHGPGGYFGSIEAHVHANVWGFLALVAAGALLMSIPHLFGAELRYPRLRSVTYWGITAGAAGLVAGPWLARHELTMGGLAVYVVGTVALLANVVGTYRAGDRTHTRRFALVLGAYLWLAFPVPWAPLVLLFPEAVPGSAIELAAIDGLVFGWMLQLAMAFLPAVAVVLRNESAEVGSQLNTATGVVGPPSWLQIASVNVGMLALWATAMPPLEAVAASLTLVGYLLIAVGWGFLVVDLWTALASRAPVAGPVAESPSD